MVLPADCPLWTQQQIQGSISRFPTATACSVGAGWESRDGNNIRQMTNIRLIAVHCRVAQMWERERDVGYRVYMMLPSKKSFRPSQASEARRPDRIHHWWRIKWKSKSGPILLDVEGPPIAPVVIDASWSKIFDRTASRVGKIPPRGGSFRIHHRGSFVERYGKCGLNHYLAAQCQVSASPVFHISLT